MNDETMNSKSDVHLCMEMNVIMDRQANYIACEQASTPTHTNANTRCRHIRHSDTSPRRN